MASGHIAQCLGGILARRAGATVAVSGDLRLNGAQLVDGVRSLAAGLLQRGVRPGDVVAVVGFNRYATRLLQLTSPASFISSSISQLLVNHLFLASSSQPSALQKTHGLRTQRKQYPKYLKRI